MSQQLPLDENKSAYILIDMAGRYLTESGFDSYIHYDAVKFSYDEAVLIAIVYDADMQEV